MATAKIPRRRTPFNFKTGSKEEAHELVELNKQAELEARRLEEPSGQGENSKSSDGSGKTKESE